MGIVSEICDYRKCFGCALCVGLCPTKAISMVIDQGFWRPHIDDVKCIGCMRCVNSCPGENGVFRSEFEMNHSCYAAYSKDDKTHFECASGGMCTEISRWFIENGGFVAGAYFNPDSQIVEHIIVDDIKDLGLLKGSKYVQSNVENIYGELVTRLPDQKGLFIGIPCQVYSVKKYSSELQIDKNLYTIDLLCHGGASPGNFKEHIRNILWDDVYKATFRGGTHDCYLCLYDAAGALKYRGAIFRDPYFNCFMEHTIFQPKCYECDFAGAERCGDLTIGDFWGLDSACLPKTGGQGINVVIINNAKGGHIFDSIKESIKSIESPLAEAVAGNDTLREATRIPKEYDELWWEINSKGFVKGLDFYSQGEWERRFLQCLKETKEQKVTDEKFLDICNKRIKEIISCSDGKNIWIYSAGKGAKILSEVFRENDICYMGYIDRNWKNIVKLNEKSVHPIEQVESDKAYVVVALMGYDAEVIEELRNRGLQDKQVCTLVSECDYQSL